jgi:hypothetical protein
MQQQVLILTREQQRIQARLGEPIEQWLRRRYQQDELTLDQLGAEVGVGASAMSRWLAQFGIEARRSGPRKS